MFYLQLSSWSTSLLTAHRQRVTHTLPFCLQSTLNSDQNVWVPTRSPAYHTLPRDESNVSSGQSVSPRYMPEHFGTAGWISTPAQRQHSLHFLCYSRPRVFSCGNRVLLKNTVSGGMRIRNLSLLSERLLVHQLPHRGTAAPRHYSGILISATSEAYPGVKLDVNILDIYRANIKLSRGCMFTTHRIHREAGCLWVA